MNLIPLPYRVLAGVLLILASVGFGFVKGISHEQGKEARQALEISQGNEKYLLDEFKRRSVKHALELAKTQKVVDNYETSLLLKDDQIRAERTARNTERLQFSTSRTKVCGPATGGQAAGTVSADDSGSTVDIDLPDTIKTSLRDSAESADYEVARLKLKVTGLQEWLITHGFYGPSKQEQ